MRKLVGVAALMATASFAQAETLTVELAIPEMDTAEYHRPYVAVWISDDSRQIVEHVAVWVEKEKWWRDMRSWWRRGGAHTELPIDGVSGATKKPGTYTVSWEGDLPEGELTLNVEAVREVGGREHLRLPLPANRSGKVEKQGSKELGLIVANIAK
ncbi:DUF2271 domain-containing protein [Gilvimarinus japonicus]|jgi:hypothetical protein|uniref:DUF2271 domain-containing protein n=1 Tax=Gilvimarinus japonicus TaxID=1796469 RepID=A0ABV7HMZ4_9GAMM